MKASERALLQSEKLASVGRLASSIAHEINNPLAAVTNLLYLIDQQANTPELKRLAGAAQDELARVSQITTHPYASIDKAVSLQILISETF